jgi:hypothetical protein
MVLAGFGCAAAFFGASQLQTHPLMSPIAFIPLVSGICAVALLVLHQYSVKNPLMPVRQLATTFPVAGIIIAMTAGAASVAVIELAGTVLQKQGDPIHTAMLFWPEFGGAVVTALLFGVLFRTRFTPLLAFAGMLLLAGGAAIFSGVATGPDAVVIIGSGLIGLGVGASVSPALFISGFSVRSVQIQRVFALIELLRGVAAFLVAPVILHVATSVGATPQAGTSIAMWACFGIAVSGAVAAAYVFLLGRARLQRPALERWEEGEAPAWDSPPLAAGIRGEQTEPALPRSGAIRHP